MKLRRQLHDPINQAIKENEKDAFDWSLNDLATELYWWTDFFQIAFFKDQRVPIPAISFERTNVRTLGHYVIGRNGFGLLENININKAHLNRPLWETLSTLLHEMVHSWEYLYLPEEERTKNWFHKKAFRKKLASFGILTDNRGCQMGVGDPYVFLLRKHGITFDKSLYAGHKGVYRMPPRPKPKGRSKLAKWSCGCGQNVRVGRKKFHATCDLCGDNFRLAAC
jgi:hypothetical protein